MRASETKVSALQSFYSNGRSASDEKFSIEPSPSDLAFLSKAMFFSLDRKNSINEKGRLLWRMSRT
jgi:hypothetical protein